MKKLPLHLKIIIGLFLGIAWAFAASYFGWNEFTKNWIDPFGVIFIRMLKFIAVPLVLFSVVGGISGLQDVSKLGKLGFKTLGFYLITTVVAVSIGLILVNIINPGSFVDEDSRIINRLSYEAWVAETDGVEILDGKYLTGDEKYKHLLSDDQLRAAQKTDDQILKKVETVNTAKGRPLDFLVEMVPENILLSISNNGLMLQVIFFAIFFGVSLALLPHEKSAALKDFVNGANEVFLKMVEIIMEAAPFFVFALMAGVLAQMANTPAQVFEIFKGLGSYSIVVVIGLATMVFIFYPMLLRLVVRGIGYSQFFKNISPAQFLAFSTSSSAATLPVTMECVEENIGVSRKITSFVLPIGATVNMDGTSLYQAVAVVFLAQLHMVDLTLGQQLTIVLTATLASIGSAAVPSAGLVMLIIVLQSVGLNPLWIAIIFPVDRILDMCRTVVNVTGDTVVCTIIAKGEGELKEN